ncbi:T9SS type A sorting domain-containing protein, partial [Maribacter dokdonensis]|uniref:T9SS type A sorting domain-containing protein n=2 Tax=Maribacter TaxID=252356 RepID=UPI003297B907
AKEITLPLDTNSTELLVKTDLDCQGVYTENILLNDEFFIYPNPIEGGDLTIYLGANSTTEATISLYKLNGSSIFSKKMKPINNEIKISVNNLATGVYMLNVTNGNTLSNYKIIRK